jgi:hypothetical protein
MKSKEMGKKWKKNKIGSEHNWSLNARKRTQNTLGSFRTNAWEGVH